MKIVIILLTHIENLPPALSLIENLINKNIEVSLITMYSSAIPDFVKSKENIKIYDVQNKIIKSQFTSIFARILRRFKVRNLIKRITEKDDIIWTVTDYDAMEVGDILKKYKHVMQLVELIEDIPIYNKVPFIKANIKRLAAVADCVVVPEYNRAFIQQALWGLKATPVVLPNKPYRHFHQRKMEIKDNVAREVIKKIKGKKIILYQGVFGYERVLDNFIKAVNRMGPDYCVLLMGRDDEPLKVLRKKYPYIHFIPFIAAPDHLRITSYAHIGLLSYINTQHIRHYSTLNAIYCAPNKMFEYAGFGVPMIGNNIPGLKVPFEMHNIGKCAETMEIEDICNAIKTIEDNYQEISKNCLNYYQSVHLDEITDKILEIVQKEKP